MSDSERAGGAVMRIDEINQLYFQTQNQNQNHKGKCNGHIQIYLPGR